MLKDWHAFWDEVPGIDFRKDFTPPLVKMTKHLEMSNLRELGEALAIDLKTKLGKDKDNLDFIVLKEDLDELIDEIVISKNSDIAARLKKRLHYLIKDFCEFQQVIKNIELKNQEKK